MSRTSKDLDYDKMRADMETAINQGEYNKKSLARMLGYKDAKNLERFFTGNTIGLPKDKVDKWCGNTEHNVEEYKLKKEVVEEFVQQELPIDQPIRIETTIVDYLKSINKYLCTLAEQQDEIIAGIRLLMEEAKTLYKEVKHGN